MDDRILEKAAAHVRAALADEGSGHDWWHIARVTALTRRIAAEEGADPLVCELAALFHDLADEKLTDSKEAAMRAIEAWLAEHGCPAPQTQAVLDIIDTMSYRGGGGAPMATAEGRVVQDADRLDAIGAIGIARTFAYAGHAGQLIHDPALPPRTAMTEAEYRNGRSTAVNHFHEKLLKLRDGMNTPAAAKLAEERHAFMLHYLDRFHAEWNAE